MLVKHQKNTFKLIYLLLKISATYMTHEEMFIKHDYKKTVVRMINKESKHA